MYLGVKKATAINTLFNVVFFFLLIYATEDRIGIFKIIKTIIFLSTFYILNIYNLEKGRYTWNDFVISFLPNFALFLVGFRLYLFDKELVVFFANLIFQNVSKIFFYKLYVKTSNVLVVGKNELNFALREILERKTYFQLKKEIEINEISELNEIIEENKINKIVVTEEIEDEKTTLILLNQKLNGLEVYDYFTFYEELEEKIPVKVINQKWILFGRGYRILHRDFNIKVKNIMDYILAIFVAVLTLPIMILSAIIIKLESKGPILFKQNRIGLGNKPFTVYKFRSMKIHDEKVHSRYAEDNDERITRFGNFMRKTRIDELPQLWNVLKGEMSFVGPRCEWDKLCKEYEKEIPFYNIRHSVKPGLTGWAQVRYPYGMGVEDALQKLTYDIYYIKHQNLSFDIIILFKTMKIVLFGRGK